MWKKTNHVCSIRCNHTQLYCFYISSSSFSSSPSSPGTAVPRSLEQISRRSRLPNPLFCQYLHDGGVAHTKICCTPTEGTHIHIFYLHFPLLPNSSPHELYFSIPPRLLLWPKNKLDLFVKSQWPLHFVYKWIQLFWPAQSLRSINNKMITLFEIVNLEDRSRKTLETEWRWPILCYRRINVNIQ